MTNKTTSAIDLVLSRIGEEFDGECRLSETEARQIADTITRLQAALAWFARRGDTLIREVQTAHSGRGAAASEWMREDDADFRSDLREAVEKARALSSVGGE